MGDRAIPHRGTGAGERSRIGPPKVEGLSLWGIELFPIEVRVLGSLRNFSTFFPELPLSNHPLSTHGASPTRPSYHTTRSPGALSCCLFFWGYPPPSCRRGIPRDCRLTVASLRLRRSHSPGKATGRNPLGVDAATAPDRSQLSTLLFP